MQMRDVRPGQDVQQFASTGPLPGETNSPAAADSTYGLDTLRFVKPVGIGDTIQARLTCKRKIDRPTVSKTPVKS